MVSLKQKIAQFSEPEEKEIYKIVSVTETDITGLKGVVVVFDPKHPTPDTEKIEYKATLWFGKTKITTPNSKLGAFLSAFVDYFEAQSGDVETALKDASNTESWIDHEVRIISWRNKDRKVQIVA